MRILGLRVDVRPSAILPAITVFVLSLIAARNKPHPVRLALASTLLFFEAEANHIAGHLVSSALVGAPIDRILLGVRGYTLYDNNDVEPYQHIGRAVGGPLGSAISMLCWWGIWRLRRNKGGGDIATLGLIYNLFFTLGSWLPIPSVDGYVILKNIAKL
jgi:Zn-dependent protease